MPTTIPAAQPTPAPKAPPSHHCPNPIPSTTQTPTTMSCVSAYGASARPPRHRGRDLETVASSRLAEYGSCLCAC
jgi:hypothetical protein